MEKIDNQTIGGFLYPKITKSYDFKVRLPRGTEAAFRRLMDAVHEEGRIVSGTIREHLLDMVVLSGRGTDNEREDFLYNGNNNEFRNYVSWYPQTDNETYKDTMIRGICDRMGIKDDAEKCKNTHITNRLLEDLGAKYAGYITRLKKDTQVKRGEKGEYESQQDYINRMAADAVLRAYNECRIGCTVMAALQDKLKKTEKACKNKNESADGDAIQILRRAVEKYEEYVRDKAQGRDVSGRDFDNMFKDHAYEVAARCLFHKDDETSFDVIVEQEIMKQEHNLKRTVLEILEGQGERLARELETAALDIVKREYIKCGKRNKFEEEMLYNAERNRGKEYKHKYYKKVAAFFAEREREVVEAYVEYLRGVIKGWRGIDVKKMRLNITAGGERSYKILTVKDIPQFASMGVERLYGLKHCLHVKLFCNAEGRLPDEKAYSYYDRETGAVISLLDEKNPSYVYMPIMVSENDKRNIGKGETLVSHVNDFDCSMVGFMDRGGELYAYLTVAAEEYKPCDRVLAEEVVGVDVNVKNELFSLSERSFLSNELFVNIPLYIYEFHKDMKPRIVENIKNNLFLGTDTMCGNHVGIGILNNLNVAYDSEKREMVDRFYKRADGSYAFRQDCYAQALRSLCGKMSDRYGKDSVQYHYVSDVIALRKGLSLVHAASTEYSEKHRHYDLLYDNDYLEKHPFSETVEAKEIQEKKDAAARYVDKAIKGLVSYLIRLIKSEGFDSIAVEQLEKGDWEKALKLKTPRSFYNGCNHFAKEEGLPFSDTAYYKENRRFFSFDPHDFRLENISLSEEGLRKNANIRLINNISKYLHISSLKNTLIIVGQHNDVQVNTVQPMYTSQADSDDSYIPSADERKNGTCGRLRQEKFVHHKDGRVSNADENAAKNIKDVLVNKIKREGLLMDNKSHEYFCQKKFLTYGGTQFEMKKTGNAAVKSVYNDVFLEQAWAQDTEKS